MSLYPIMKRITTPLWLVLLVLLGVLYIVHHDPYFLLHAVGYMAVWVGYRYTLKKFKSLTPHVLFLVIFFLYRNSNGVGLVF